MTRRCPNPSPRVIYHPGTVTREERSKLLKQTGATVWFTGLSGSGKSTLAMALEQVLIGRGHAAYVLDGDNVRFGLNAGPKVLADTRGYAEEQAKRFGLGFSPADREENVRRIGEVAKLFADAGLFALSSFISPYRKDRAAVRTIHEQNRTGAIPFIEVYVNTPIETCEKRDPKGLYRKARAGELKGFTGIDDPYEAPLRPEVTVDTDATTPQQAAEVLIRYLQRAGYISI